MKCYGLNRTIGDALGDMRTQLSLNVPVNKSLLISLVEEAQVMANRMEGALLDVKDIEDLHKEINSLKKLSALLQEGLMEIPSGRC